MSDAASALVAMAELVCSAAEAPVHAPAAEVMVHIGVDALVAHPSSLAADPAAQDEDQVSRPTVDEVRLDDGPALSLACAQRLACDGRVRLTVHGNDGRTLDVGRWRRRPTTAQRLTLWQRDRGCAVPGCGRATFLHAHHVQAWSRGG